MEFMANPPTLGGGFALAVLFAWALGRLQGAAGLGGGLGGGLGSGQGGDHRPALDQPLIAPPAGVPLAAATCPEPSRSALLTALAAADQLGDLHDEVSAFRRRERVFATLSPDLLQPAPMADDAARVCVRVGVIGLPVCDGIGCRVAGASAAPGAIAATEAAPILRVDSVSPRRACQP